MQYFLGIDGGGTKTRAVLVNDTLQVVGTGISGASNHHAVSADKAVQHCAEAAQLAISDAMRIDNSVHKNSIAGWGFGLAGVRRESDAFLMRGRLNSLCGETPWILETDAVAAHFGAFNGGTGIVQIAGTGAVSLGVDASQERFYTDGWGPVMGDEGGGYWIGQQALRIACRSADGRAPRSSLTGAVLGAFGVADCNALVDFLRKDKASRETIAGLARLVFDTANGGVHEAISIREQATDLLAQSITATAKRILTRHQERSIGDAKPLHLSLCLLGGLLEDEYFKAGVAYNIGERFVELKNNFLPLDSWRIVKPQFDAASGAALLIISRVVKATEKKSEVRS
ncbi:MAG: BadF/BadG/BcrA/BcrD ATPase family protein [Abditibacteriaceae bacterium]